MRRSDRQVVDQTKIFSVIQKCDCCRLAIKNDPVPYLIPLNFGFLPEGNGIFYFHSAKEGTKLDLLRKNPEVSFELDTSHAVKKGRFACEYSFYYQSVIGTAKVQFVEEPSEKEKALSLLMKQYSTEQNFSFSPASFARTVILKMTVESISCKEYLPPQS